MSLSVGASLGGTPSELPAASLLVAPAAAHAVAACAGRAERRHVCIHLDRGRLRVPVRRLNAPPADGQRRLWQRLGETQRVSGDREPARALRLRL